MTAYSYDIFGWYAGEVADGTARSTSIAPTTTSQTTTDGETRANWSGAAWVDMSYVTQTVPTQFTKKVPFEVTMRQARLAIHNAGLLPTLDALIAAADMETQITWEASITVERNNPITLTLASALNLTDDQLDDLFIAAAIL